MNKAAPAKTILTETVGKSELRLAIRGGGVFGLFNGKVIVEGDDQSQVWNELYSSSGQSSPQYFGIAGARNKFRKFFPNGFQSDGYAGHERDYKLKAKNKLDGIAPLGKAMEAEGLGAAIMSVYQATNLLSVFEKTRMQALLKSEKADHFIRAAARFTIDKSASALKDMEVAFKAHDNAKWTAITYLPFLWRPSDHMFLKPTVSVDFAERVGHPFSHVYEPRIKMDIYDSLLDLTRKTAIELVDLGPRDWIDIQSFIWVIGGSYDDEAARP